MAKNKPRSVEQLNHKYRRAIASIAIGIALGSILIVGDATIDNAVKIFSVRVRSIPADSGNIIFEDAEKINRNENF